MVVFFIVSIIGLLYTTSGYAQTFMYDLFVVICILFCMVNFINSTDDIHFMFQALMVGGFVLDFYIIYLYGGNFIDAIFNDTRVGELAGNANEVGIKSCYASCIALFFVINEKQPTIKKAIYSIICLVCAFFSVITASRKVLLLLLLGFLFLLLFRENKSMNAVKLVRNICFAFGAILFIIFLVYNIDAFSLLRNRIDEFFSLLQTGGGNHGDKNRIMFFQEGWRVFLEHPFWGDGTACSDVYFGTYSHCNYIEILMSNGVLGFLVFYFSYPIIFFRLLSRRKYVFLRKSTLGPNSKISMDILCLFVFIW